MRKLPRTWLRAPVLVAVAASLAQCAGSEGGRCGQRASAGSLPPRHCLSIQVEAPGPLSVNLRLEPLGAARGGGAGCGDTNTDNNNCGTCGHACATGTACAAGRCVRMAGFRIARMETTGCVLSSDHEALSSDDCGGIAVSSSRLFYNGDGAAITVDADGLTGPASLGTRHAALLSDLRTGTVYVLMDATGVERPNGFGSSASVVTQLGVLDGTSGALTARRVALSSPLSFGNDAGIYAGYGGVVVHTGTNGVPAGQWYHVALPSGAVSSLGTRPAAPGHQGCETFAHWGIAEFFGGEHHVLYMGRTPAGEGVLRYRLRDGAVTPVVSGVTIGDTCMITFSPARNRWYFHFESTPSFAPAGSYGEFLGYCPGTAEIMRARD